MKLAKVGAACLFQGLRCIEMFCNAQGDPPLAAGYHRYISCNGAPSYQKEAPRLCRGGSRSLTFQEVVHRRDFQS